MSKQKKSPARALAAETPEELVGAGPELEEQRMLGNQALQDELHGVSSVRGGHAALRESLEVLVRRGQLALQWLPREEAAVARLIEIVSRSGLSEERKEALSDRLLEDHEGAVEANELVQRWFGRVDAAGRSELIQALGRVPGALGELELKTQQAVVSTDQRAELLVGELAQREGATPSAAAITGFCRDAVLLLHFEEDEEEEPGTGDYAVEEGAG